MHSKMLENITFSTLKDDGTWSEPQEMKGVTDVKIVHDAEAFYMCDSCDGLGFIRHVGSQYENGELIVDCMTCDGTGDMPTTLSFTAISSGEITLEMDSIYTTPRQSGKTNRCSSYRLDKPKDEFFIQGQKTGLDLIYAMAGYFDLNEILYDNVLGSYFKSVTVRNKPFNKMLKGAAKLAEVQQ
jgi:hypothetical protein